MRALDLPQESSPDRALQPPARRSALADLWGFRHLVKMLVVRELKVRYKRSVFGVLWTMLNPLLLMVVYAIVFTTILPAGRPNFAVFLLSGLLPWIFFSTSVVQGLNSVIGNQELIRKVRVPQAVFPLSVVGSNLVNFTLSLVPLLVLMAVLHQRFTPALLFLPVATLLLALFAGGVTLLLATFTVFFRDVRHLTEVALQMLLYLSPVLYDFSMVGQHREWWFRAFRVFLALNPLSYLVPLVREPVYYGRMPSTAIVAPAAAWAAGAFVVGLAVFVRLSRRHIHYL